MPAQDAAKRRPDRRVARPPVVLGNPVRLADRGEVAARPTDERPGSSPSLSWATFPHPLPNMAAGALAHPETSGNWTPSLPQV